MAARLGVKTAGIYTTVPTQYADGSAFIADNLKVATLFFFDTTNFTPLPPGIATLAEIDPTLEATLLGLIGGSSVIGSILDTRSSLGVSAMAAVGFEDDFLGATLSTANFDVDVSGTGAAVTQPNTSGLSVVALVNGTTDDGHATLATDLSFLSSAPLTMVETRLKIDDLAEVSIEFGFSDSQSEAAGLAFTSHDTATAVATNAAVFGFLHDTAGSEVGTTWRMLTVKAGGTPTKVAVALAPTAPVAATFVDLAVVLALNGAVVDASFFINGVQVGSALGSVAPGIPMFVWLSTHNYEVSDAKTVETDYIRVYQNR